MTAEMVLLKLPHPVSFDLLQKRVCGRLALAVTLLDVAYHTRVFDFL
jgi:hypothetical protein